VLTLLFVIALNLTGAPHSQAATSVTSRGPGYMVSVPGYGNIWLGVYNTSRGPAFCIDPGGVSPIGKSGNDPAWLTSWTNRQGTKMTPTQLAQASAVMMWFNSSSRSHHDAAATKLALFTVLGLTHQELYGGHGYWLNFDITVPGSTINKAASRLGILQKSLDLVAYAKSHAAPWDGTTANVTHNLDEIRWPGEQINYSVQLPGVPAGNTITFTVKKPDGSSQAITAKTDGAGQASIELETDPQLQGRYQVSWSISGIPERYPRAFTGGGSPPQKLMLLNGSRSASGATAVVYLASGEISISTRISDQSAQPGSTIRDTVSAQGLVPMVYGQPVDWVITGAIHRATATGDTCENIDWGEADQVWEFTHHLDNTTINADGTVEVTIGDYLIPRHQPAYCYTYVVTLTGTTAFDDEDPMEADHPMGEALETTLVRSDLPTIVTQISDQRAAPGAQIVDTITIENLHFDPVDGEELTWTMEGVLVRTASKDGSCASSNWGNATTVMIYEMGLDPELFDEQGVAILPGAGPFVIPRGEPSYCYSYGETLVGTWESMETPVRVEHPVGQVAQTTHTLSGIHVPTGGMKLADNPPKNRSR
jgi:hypothetical protein